MAKAKNRAKTGRKGARKATGTFHPDPNVRLKRVGDKTFDLSDYVKVKTAAGNTSLSCGDATAKSLQGLELEDVYKKASKVLGVPVTELKSRYSKLNPGMQRMNLGNRMRAAA